MDTNNTLRITKTAATIAALLGAEKMNEAAQPLEPVLKRAAAEFGKLPDRVFIYNPDAVAMWLWQKYTELYTEMLVRTEMTLPVYTVMPSVTPVCFGSMYSGLMPEQHGITSYTKPVLKCGTLFDCAVKAGKRVALIAEKNSSMSIIFGGRDIDYFIFDTVAECNLKALELIEKDEHDLIIDYNGNYDENMHRCSPEGEAAMTALKDNIAAFAKLHDAIAEKWNEHDTVLAFAPDHGCHEIDGKLGSHGLDMVEDMNILHFYSFIKSR